MAEKNKRGFHTVEEPDMKEYEQKIREHRLKIFKNTSITILVILLLAAGIGLFMALRHYESYDVISSVQREDTEAAHFTEFAGNLLKYSNDGALYTDTSNDLIWNQTYEMADPQISICNKYLTIYDKRGTMIYILTPEGLQGSIETTMPVEQVCIAAQGTVAVLMKKDSAGYLAVYDKSGSNLVEGAIHGEKGGYPVAIALSNDAIKLAVSMLDINEGKIKSTVAFYNFGSVGENEIDHVVGAVSFSDTVVPELYFNSQDQLMALTDSGILFFEGAQKPKQSDEIKFDKEVKTVFYNDRYIGLVTSNDDEAVTHHFKVYDTKGNLVTEKDFEMEYTSIGFMSNNEICIRNETVCDIYTIRGIYKFHHEFEDNLYQVIPGGAGLNYTFILEGITEKARLK